MNDFGSSAIRLAGKLERLLALRLTLTCQKRDAERRPIAQLARVPTNQQSLECHPEVDKRIFGAVALIGAVKAAES